MKQFLKPDWRKILTTIVLMLLPLIFLIRAPTGPLIYDSTIVEFYTRAGGFPFPWLVLNMFGWTIAGWQVLYLYLVLDLLLFYLPVCLVFWLWDRKKRIQ